MTDQLESKIQSCIVSWYNNTYCLLHHNPRCIILSIPNGGNKTVREHITARATGEYKGASDLLVIHFGKVMFIEVKDSIGKQKPDQIKFQQHVESMGLPYYLVRSLEEFKSIVEPKVIDI